MSLLYHGVWKSQKKSHFTTSRTKRATFIFSPSIDDLEPFLCFEVNPDHENWPFNFVNIKGLQVWSVFFSLHKKGFKSLIEGQENESYEMLVSVWKFKWDIFQWICNTVLQIFSQKGRWQGSFWWFSSFEPVIQNPLINQEIFNSCSLISTFQSSLSTLFWQTWILISSSSIFAGPLWKSWVCSSGALFPFFDGNRNVGGALVDDKKSEGHLDL